MPQKIPFFQLFPDLTPPPALKTALLGTLIRSAVIHQKDYSMEMTLETRSPLAPEELRTLEEMILRDYAFTKVTLQADCVSPPPPPPAERAGEGKPAASGGGKGDLLYGREIKGKPVPIRRWDPPSSRGGSSPPTVTRPGSPASGGWPLR